MNEANKPEEAERNVFETDELDEDAGARKERKKDQIEEKKRMDERLAKMSPEEIFALFDTDGSGEIDFNEFRALLPQLGIKLAPAKMLRYFHLCDTDGSGSIDLEEMKVALFAMDPNSGNTAGFQPTALLTPIDAFELFDEDGTGYLGEDEFNLACEFLKLGLSEARMEKLFQRADVDGSGYLTFEEFRGIWLSVCNVHLELANRGVEVPRFARKKDLMEQLLQLIEDEERKEEQALAEARRWRQWQLMLKERREHVQQAQFRADIELRRALDAAGEVFLFGRGTHSQFEADPLKRLKTKHHDLHGFDKVVNLWRWRVRPQEMVAQYELERGIGEQQRAERLEMLEARDNAAKSGEEVDVTVFMMADPYEEALASKFHKRIASVSTAALWGRRVHQVAVTDSVVFALTDVGDMFAWGGTDYWWHEIQPDSMYQNQWRGNTTHRSQLLLQTLDNVDPGDEFEGLTDKEQAEEKEAEKLKAVTKYYGVWKPPPGQSMRLQFLREELLPKITFEDVKASLEIRGKVVQNMTKNQLLDELYEDICLERRLLGERGHRSIRELEQQIKGLVKEKKMNMANKLKNKVAEAWDPLKELQAEERAEEKERQIRLVHERIQGLEDGYLQWRDSIVRKRETLEPRYTPRGNSVQINVSGITPRAGDLRTPRGYACTVGIAAGANHVCAVHKTGHLYSWGLGTSGRLGLDETQGGDPQNSAGRPTLVQALVGKPVIRVACGFNHSAAVVVGGQLYMWGSAAAGKLGLGESAREVECYCSVPTHVPIARNVTVRKVSCGGAHTAVVTDAGQLYVWGCGNGGRLGLGANRLEDVYTPRLVNSLLHEQIQSVSCGTFHTLAVSKIQDVYEGTGATRIKKRGGGLVYAAGAENVLGEYCPSFAVLECMREHPVKQVTAGYMHSGLITAEGELRTWGANSNGCCGVDPSIRFLSEPMPVDCLYRKSTNLALHKPCTQSSTFNGQEGTLATNGDTNGFWAANCTCTHQDPQAWWEVDLGDYAYIEEVRLWNRVDEPADTSLPRDRFSSRLFPCWVMIGQAPFITTEGATSLNANLRNAAAKVRFTENMRVCSWKVPENTIGRFVRVQLEGFEFLHMAQVEIFGTWGLDRGMGRVSFAQCGKDCTVAVIRALSDPQDLELAYSKAVFADPNNADLLRQLESYVLVYDKVGRGEVVQQEKCRICRGSIKCEICELRDTYAEELAEMPMAAGGRVPGLREIAEFLEYHGQPEVVIPAKPKRVLPTWKQVWAERLRGCARCLLCKRKRKQKPKGRPKKPSARDVGFEDEAWEGDPLTVAGERGGTATAAVNAGAGPEEEKDAVDRALEYMEGEQDEEALAQKAALKEVASIAAEMEARPDVGTDKDSVDEMNNEASDLIVPFSLHEPTPRSHRTNSSQALVTATPRSDKLNAGLESARSRRSNRSRRSAGSRKSQSRRSSRINPAAPSGSVGDDLQIVEYDQAGGAGTPDVHERATNENSAPSPPPSAKKSAVPRALEAKYQQSMSLGHPE